MQRTTTIALSQRKLDSLSFAQNRKTHDSTAFWEEATGTKLWATLYERVEEERKEFRHKIRRSKVIVQNLFIGKELDCMTILMTSANPIHDVASQLGVCLEEAYRKVAYLRRVMAELYIYFAKGTYRTADQILRKYLTKRQYEVYVTVTRARDVQTTAHILGARGYYNINRTIKRVERFLHRGSYKYRSIKDLFVVWKRVRKIKKTYYGNGKRYVKVDLDKE